MIMRGRHLQVELRFRAVLTYTLVGRKLTGVVSLCFNIISFFTFPLLCTAPCQAITCISDAEMENFTSRSTLLMVRRPNTSFRAGYFTSWAKCNCLFRI
jgi:hypothetical protein